MAIEPVIFPIMVIFHSYVKLSEGTSLAHPIKSHVEVVTRLTPRQESLSKLWADLFSPRFLFNQQLVGGMVPSLTLHVFFPQLIFERIPHHQWTTGWFIAETESAGPSATVKSMARPRPGLRNSRNFRVHPGVISCHFCVPSRSVLASFLEKLGEMILSNPDLSMAMTQEPTDSLEVPTSTIILFSASAFQASKIVRESPYLHAIFSHLKVENIPKWRLVGDWGKTPLKNMSQLGWWHSQYMETQKMFQTTNQNSVFLHRIAISGSGCPTYMFFSSKTGNLQLCVWLTGRSGPSVSITKLWRVDIVNDDMVYYMSYHIWYDYGYNIYIYIQYIFQDMTWHPMTWLVTWVTINGTTCFQRWMNLPAAPGANSQTKRLRLEFLPEGTRRKCPVINMYIYIYIYI